MMSDFRHLQVDPGRGCQPVVPGAAENGSSDAAHDRQLSVHRRSTLSTGRWFHVATVRGAAHAFRYES